MRRAKVATHLWQMIQRRDVFLPETVEQRAHLRGNLTMRAQGLGQRIYKLAIFFDCEMQMRSGGETGRAHPSDHLANAHLVSRLEARRDLRQVAVDTDHALIVIDLYAVAQFAAPSRALDAAIRNRLNRRAVMSHQIDADVRPIFMEYRMVAMETEA